MSNLFYSLNIDYFINLIDKGIHFKYSRFNDGELIAIIGQTPNSSNCDGHIYFTEMSIELKNALINYSTNDKYYFLESYIYWYNILPNINKIINHLKDVNSNLKFIEDDFIRISHENSPEKFIQLMKLIMSKNVVIVGPDYLSKLLRFFKFKHIVVPIKNCYLSKNSIIKEINELNQISDNNIYLFSASMATNVIIDHYKHDNNNTYIDWGSTWDTFYVSSEYSHIHKRSTSSGEKYKNIYKDYLI